MSPDDLVSIIIPFFNRPEQTLEAIRSALNQTYKNIEIIIIDDASEHTIEHHEVLSDPKITFLKHTDNLGANAARNSGLKRASGYWISFLDSDDTWEPEKLDVMVSALKQNDDFSVAYCGIKKILDGEVKSVQKPTPVSDVYKSLLSTNIIGSASVPVISYKVFDTVDGFDEQLKSAQDWDLWLRIAEQKFKFLCLSTPLVNYTLPTQSGHISNSENSFWKGRLQFLKKHKPKYKGHNRKALGQIYSDIAYLLLHRFSNRLKALYCFVLAILHNPKRSKSWRGLVAIFLPRRTLSKFNKL